MSSTRRSRWLLLLISAICCMLNGCTAQVSPAPPIASNPSDGSEAVRNGKDASDIEVAAAPTAQDDQAITSQEVGNIALPTPIFNFFERLDRERIAARFAEYHAPFQALPRPQGMDDDVYERCQRAMADRSEAKELFTLTQAETGSIKQMRFIENKYLVILSDKLTVWRLEDKEKIRTVDLPEPAIDYLNIGYDANQPLLTSKTKLYKYSFTDAKVVSEVEVPEGIRSVDMAFVTGDVAVCTSTNRLLLFSSDLKQRNEGPDITLASSRISIHPYAAHVLCNTEKMTRWIVNPSKVELYEAAEFYPKASTPSAGLIYDRWVSPFSIYELRDGGHTRTINNAPNPPVPMSRVLVNVSNCFSLVFSDWCVVLAFDKEVNTKKTSVIDVMPFSESASVPTAFSPEPVRQGTIASNAERMAFVTSTGLHVVSRDAWVCRTGTADALSIAYLLDEGRLEQFQIAAEYLRSHKRLPRGISGEKLYSNIVGAAAQVWRCWDEKDHAELLKKIEEWHQKGSLLSTLVSACMHRQLASAARGNEVINSVSTENLRIFQTESQKVNEELAKIDYLKVPPAIAYSLALSPSSDFVSDLAAMEDMLLDYSHSYPWETEAHVSRGLACLPRWGGEDRQIGAYVHALASAYPPVESERMYSCLVASLGSMADELPDESFGFDYARMSAGLRAMMKDESLPQDFLESALSVCKRKTADLALVKALSDYHVKHFDLIQSGTFPVGTDRDLYKARNRALFGTDTPQPK